MKKAGYNEIQSELSRLKKEYGLFKRSAFFMIGYLLIIILIAVLVKNVYLIMVLLFAAVLVQVFLVRRFQKQYTRDFRLSNLRLTTARMLETDEISEKSGGRVDAELTERAELIPCSKEKDSFMAYMGMDGKYKGIPVCTADVTFREDFRLVEKGRNRAHINCGCWIHLDLAEENPYDFRIIHELAVPTPMLMNWMKERLQLRQIPASEKELSAEYYILSRRDELPGDGFFKSFRKLQEYTPGYCAVSVRGKSLDVFIRNRVLNRAVSITEGPDEKGLMLEAMPEIEKIREMSSCL